MPNAGVEKTPAPSSAQAKVTIKGIKLTFWTSATTSIQQSVSSPFHPSRNRPTDAGIEFLPSRTTLPDEIQLDPSARRKRDFRQSQRKTSVQHLSPPTWPEKVEKRNELQRSDPSAMVPPALPPTLVPINKPHFTGWVVQISRTSGGPQVERRNDEPLTTPTNRTCPR